MWPRCSQVLILYYQVRLFMEGYGQNRCVGEDTTTIRYSLGREYIPAGCSEAMVVQGGISPPDAETSWKNRTITINDGYLSEDIASIDV